MIIWGACAAAALFPAAANAAAAPGPRPNVVVIVTDDQELSTYTDRFMPRTRRLLVDHGTDFSQAVVSTPQCCPSRAQLLTGQYAHNSGVTSNRSAYPSLRQKRNVLPAWLRRDGYRTIHIGKFLNAYATDEGLAPAPGWDRWLTTVATNYMKPVFSVDGAPRAPQRYLTGVLSRMSVRAVRRYAPRRRPFYLQVDHYAPHVDRSAADDRCAGVALPARRDRDLFSELGAPRVPGFNEADISDKPSFMSTLPSFEPAVEAEIDRHYGCAAAALAAVDRSVADLVSALRQVGELRRTMIVFTSDNGYSFGQHRIPYTKGLGYDEHLRVPLTIRPPREFPRLARRGRRLSQPVANVDIAPTVLAAAGAEPCIRRGCRRLDGHPLLRLAKGHVPGWSKHRAIATSFDIGRSQRPGLSCAWNGFRTPRASLIVNTAGPDPATGRCHSLHEPEYYDLRADPFQLASSSAIPASALRRTHRLSRCSGVRGRDRRLPGRPYCE